MLVMNVLLMAVLLWQAHPPQKQAHLWIVQAEYMAGECPAWETPVQIEPDARAVGACGWTCDPSDGRIARVVMHFTRPGAANKAVHYLRRTGHVLGAWREQELPKKPPSPSRIWLRD